MLFSMTPKAFQKLIDKNHLTAEALSIYFSVDRPSIENWTTGKAPIPPSVADSLKTLNELIEGALSRALSVVFANKFLKVPILRYENEQDFFEFDDDAELFRTVKVHQGLVKRVVETLKLSGITAYAVAFNKSRYLSWTKAERLGVDRSTRAAWSVLQKD